MFYATNESIQSGAKRQVRIGKLFRARSLAHDTGVLLMITNRLKKVGKKKKWADFSDTLIINKAKYIAEQKQDINLERVVKK